MGARRRLDPVVRSAGLGRGVSVTGSVSPVGRRVPVPAAARAVVPRVGYLVELAWIAS
jgi:hypothetical protein